MESFIYDKYSKNIKIDTDKLKQDIQEMIVKPSTFFQKLYLI